MTVTTGFKTGYLDPALDHLDEVLDNAVVELRNVDFDTLVGTGFSGALVVPALALRLHKSFILVRKANDGSHHSGRMIGNLGQRWVFVDDFVASGSTRHSVMEAVERSALERDHRTTYMGDYLYARPTTRKFYPAAEVSPFTFYRDVDFY